MKTNNMEQAVTLVANTTCHNYLDNHHHIDTDQIVNVFASIWTGLIIFGLLGLNFYIILVLRSNLNILRERICHYNDYQTQTTGQCDTVLLVQLGQL